MLRLLVAIFFLSSWGLAQQYGLPASDQTNGCTTETGNANGEAWDELDEGFGSGRGTGSGPDDATTMWASAAKTICAITMPTNSLTDPSSSSGHILRIRSRKDVAAGIQYDSSTRLYEGATCATEIVRNTALVDMSATWATGTYTLSAGEANSITDYTNLCAFVNLIPVGGGASRVGQTSAAEVEVPSAGAPSAARRRIIVTD
jgi:hypothetical protein